MAAAGVNLHICPATRLRFRIWGFGVYLYKLYRADRSGFSTGSPGRVARFCEISALTLHYPVRIYLGGSSRDYILHRLPPKKKK